MGGQSSRMVREIVEDSMYIIRHTNRATYEQSVHARAEVQSKLEELERVNKEILKAPEDNQVFRTFENVDAQKKALDEQVSKRNFSRLLNGAVVSGADACGLLSVAQVESFAKQFELPSYTKIAEQRRAAKKDTEA